MTDPIPSLAATQSFLSEDVFQNEQSRRLFEAIDELRSCGANHEIDLPELIIVGDQSAGKSSLLQSLTDIPFPVSDRLCTRFPTRIVSRRTPHQTESVRVSIEPSTVSVFEKFSQQSNIFSGVDQAARLDRLGRYAKFTRTIPTLTAEGFKEIFNEAVDLMGIPRPSSSPGQNEVNGVINQQLEFKQNFSNDVLKVEISGANRSYFSILDLPGIFQSLTKDLTEVEKNGVRNLSAAYMTSKQSVIICVASGTNDLANQAVFDLASEKDPTGDRTVGVITKCDIAQHPNQLLDLAGNTEKYFRHGWFVVRNRTPSEVQASMEPSERHIKETEFFNSAPWNAFVPERRGTQALKRYLAELLSNRTLETFPTILTTLRERIKSTTIKMEGLGLARGTPEEKRAFLTKIAQEFNSLASQALRGRYDSLATNNLKLRRLVREANDNFSWEMKRSGHAVPFLDIPQVDDKKEDMGPVSTSSVAPVRTAIFGHLDSGRVSSNVSSVRPLLPFSKDLPLFEQAEVGSDIRNIFQNVVMTRQSKFCSFEELRLSDYARGQIPPKSNPGTRGGSIFSPASIPTANNINSGLFAASNISRDLNQGREHSDIYKLIKQEVQANRGTELQGTFNPDILPALFHKQIVNWEAHSKSHFLRVTKLTVFTLVAIVSLVCPDPTVRERLERAIRRASDAAEKKGLKQLSDRLTTLSSAHLQTNNSNFIEKVRTARLQRFQAALERYRSRHAAAQPPLPQKSPVAGFPVEEDTKFTIDMRDTAILFDELHVSNAQNLADEIHDVLKAYYEIARDDFVEYVNHHIVEPFLNSPDGPVFFFSPLYVSELAPDQLESLAIEQVSLVRERRNLDSTLGRLKRAEGIALKYS